MAARLSNVGRTPYLVGRARLCSSLLGALKFGGAAMGMGAGAAGWFGAPPGWAGARRLRYVVCDAGLEG